MRPFPPVSRPILVAVTAALVSVAAPSAPADASPRRSLDALGPTVVIGVKDIALCVLETQRDNISEAFYWCDRVVRRGETSVDERSVAYMHRGVLHLKTHDLKAAVADIDKSIELTPHFGDAHFNRGNAMFALGNYEEAVASYGRALENDVTTPELAFYNRAKAHQRLGDEEKAKADLVAAQERMPANSPLTGRVGGQ